MVVTVAFLKRTQDNKTRAFLKKTMDAPSITEAVVWAGNALKKTNPALLAQVVAVRVYEAKTAAVLA